jgi:oligoribonuclease NrnB/cAMP/cGMP phosphodiesterase (DHH superfamily)
MASLRIYFHKDFDGFVAAALFLKINEESGLIGASQVLLKTVDYDLKDKWLNTHLPQPNVVLDFLYHPEAEWWFDHHVSTFVRKSHERKYQNSEKHFWDIHSPSCAALIKQHLQDYNSLFMGNEEFQNLTEKFSEWIKWSDIIDNAKFENPAQVIELKDPCLEINATLSAESEDSYYEYLVYAAKKFLPREVIEMPTVRNKIDEAKDIQDKCINVFKNNLEKFSDGTVFFNYVKNGIPFQRYLAYYFKSDARYSVGLYLRTPNNYYISVGKNPWSDFTSKNIGEICEQFGGGGRVNVGGISVKNYEDALAKARKICAILDE